MSRSHHARPSCKRPRRHAGDAVFHLDNALRSINAILNQARDEESYTRARRLRAGIQSARDAAADLRAHLGREQGRDEQQGRAA